MRPQFIAWLSSVAFVALPTLAWAQSARPVAEVRSSAASAESPALVQRAPAKPLASSGNEVAGATIAASDTFVPVREAPKATNPVLAAFTVQPGGLTANEVALRAVATSDTIAAKNAELKAAAQAVDTTRFQFLPRLGLKASYARLSPATAQLGSGYVGRYPWGKLR